MQLTRHQTNAKLSDLILDNDRQHLKQTLGALPEWAQAAAERPDAFWERQQTEIRKRIATVPAPSFVRAATAWTGALAMVLLALFLMHGNPAPRLQGTQTDPDQELLVAVEQTVQSGVPQSLEPAAMLAEEISSSNRPHVTSPSQGELK